MKWLCLKVKGPIWTNGFCITLPETNSSHPFHISKHFSNISFTFFNHLIHVWHFMTFLRHFHCMLMALCWISYNTFSNTFRIISRLRTREHHIYERTTGRAGSWSASRSTQQVEGRVKTQTVLRDFFLWMWMMFGQISSRPKTQVFHPKLVIKRNSVTQVLLRLGQSAFPLWSAAQICSL